LAVGDRGRASTLADELLDAWRSGGVQPALESVGGAWLFGELGRGREFVEALERARARTPWHEAARLVVGGDLAGAAELYAEIGSVPDEAYARLRAAGAFVGSGRRAEADGQLRLALPVLAQLGATAWAAEAEALLAESA
jgi:hypothetical protein